MAKKKWIPVEEVVNTVEQELQDSYTTGESNSSTCRLCRMKLHEKCFKSKCHCKILNHRYTSKGKFYMMPKNV